MRVVALAAAAMALGCVNPGSFVCAVHDECGEGGACEASGYCSFVDDSCPQGRRYGEHAGGFAGRCVASDDTPVAAVVALESGAGHTCALLEDGIVTCWGGNRDGALGDGTRLHRDSPIEVPGLPGIAAIGAGRLHSCALDVEGGVWCWGGGDRGQLGDGEVGDRDRAVAVDVAPLEELAVGDYHTCGREAEGQVWCWGANHHGQLGAATGDDDDDTGGDAPSPIESAVDDAVELFAAGNVTCARRAAGGIVCWGDNSAGQLGLGDTRDRKRPTSVPWLDGAAGVAIGGAHVCALAVSGALSCAGANDFGQLGDGTTEPRHTPVAVSGMSGAVDVATGTEFSCARGVDAVVCWGRNEDGELGAGAGASRSTPGAQVALPDGRAARVSPGNRHACAVDPSGCVWCWGSDELGQLGNGPAAGDQPVRVELACAEAK